MKKYDESNSYSYCPSLNSSDKIAAISVQLCQSLHRDKWNHRNAVLFIDVLQ